MDRQGLRDFISRCPIIDHHGHNLIEWGEQKTSDLHQCISEATGDALSDAQYSLAHLHAARQLNDLSTEYYQGTASSSQPDNADHWQAYLAKRRTFEEKSCTQEAFRGVQTVLVDDGLRTNKTLHQYDWHSQFTPTPAKRIVRIETLAEDIILNLVQNARTRDDSAGTSLLHAFEEQLDSEISKALLDDEVAAFKSAICYRTGLAIDISTSRATLKQAFDALVMTVSGMSADSKPPRIDDKPLNDHIVRYLARRIARHAAETGKHAKPLQFHTGLGDNDLTLALSNPSCLQSFMEANPRVPIVLLHASYPFTREAGYLATMYRNVYLDLGLVFPMLSRDGQERVIRQALELTPTTKLCWSTDGHFYPETYLLATVQVRATVEAVLSDMAENGDVSYDQAAKIAKDLLFETSNRLYNLNINFELLDDQLLQSRISDRAKVPSNHDLLAKFMKQHPNVLFIRVNWMDYTSTVRTRVFPAKKLLQKLSSPGDDGTCCGIGTSAAHFALQNDHPAVADFSATGELPLIPDYSRIYVYPRKNDAGKPIYANVMGTFVRPDKSTYELDCRRRLFRAVEQAHQAGAEKLLMGSEIEFCLFESEALAEGMLKPISKVHSWTTARSLLAKGGEALKILEEITEALQQAGIEVEQWHSESGPGQYEISLGPLPPLRAMDQLVHAREVISYIAAEHGYRATIIPKPDPKLGGNGAHLHMSISPTSLQESFFAGILKQLPALCAFTLPSEDSYERVSDGTWSGGTWCMWGEQNREAPLRRVEAKDAHWEMKTFDGLANVYLAAAAILHAGILGIEAKASLPEPCNVDASEISEQKRAQIGITRRLPLSQQEAMRNLKNATDLTERLGSEIVSRYIEVKGMEADLHRSLEAVGEEETTEQGKLRRKLWMMERY